MCTRKKFCGGYSYRLGALLAAVVQGFWALSHFVLATAFFNQAALLLKERKTNDYLLEYSVVFGLYTITCLLSFVSLIIFVTGVSKNSHALVLTYLVCDTLQMTVSAVGCVWGLNSHMYICCIPLCITIGKIYLWYVIFEFYRDLRLYYPSGNEGVILI